MENLTSLFLLLWSYPYHPFFIKKRMNKVSLTENLKTVKVSPLLLILFLLTYLLLYLLFIFYISPILVPYYFSN